MGLQRSQHTLEKTGNPKLSPFPSLVSCNCQRLRLLCWRVLTGPLLSWQCHWCQWLRVPWPFPLGSSIGHFPRPSTASGVCSTKESLSGKLGSWAEKCKCQKPPYMRELLWRTDLGQEVGPGNTPAASWPPLPNDLDTQPHSYTPEDSVMCLSQGETLSWQKHEILGQGAVRYIS